MKRLEQGIPFDPQILLEPSGQSLAEFEELMRKRRPKMEFSLLSRLNCYIDKFGELYKNFNSRFVEKNRYPDMLPFNFNRVKLNKQVRPFMKLSFPMATST